jgi:hypothetical protein
MKYLAIQISSRFYTVISVNSGEAWLFYWVIRQIIELKMLNCESYEHLHDSLSGPTARCSSSQPVQGTQRRSRRTCIYSCWKRNSKMRSPCLRVARLYALTYIFIQRNETNTIILCAARKRLWNYWVAFRSKNVSSPLLETRSSKILYYFTISFLIKILSETES